MRGSGRAGTILPRSKTPCNEGVQGSEPSKDQTGLCSRSDTGELAAMQVAHDPAAANPSFARAHTPGHVYVSTLHGHMPIRAVLGAAEAMLWPLLYSRQVARAGFVVCVACQ